jgi:hypothetical protein
MRRGIWIVNGGCDVIRLTLSLLFTLRGALCFVCHISPHFLKLIKRKGRRSVARAPESAKLLAYISRLCGGSEDSDNRRYAIGIPLSMDIGMENSCLHCTVVIFSFLLFNST